jgi:hypothetical protein
MDSLDFPRTVEYIVFVVVSVYWPMRHLLIVAVAADVVAKRTT